MGSVFITATGTEIGKTHISCAFLSRLQEQGRMPLPIKPLMSGFDEADLASSDAGRLLKACGRKVTSQEIATICMKRFTAPLAPNVAARQVGQTLDYDDILAFVNARMLGADGPVLVEGAGGVMSPVTDEKLHVDLIRDLAMPTFLVTANYLGSVSHTLSALEVLSRRVIPVLGVIVSQPTADAPPPQPLIEELARWSDVRLLAADYRPSSDLTELADMMIQLAR